jgi:hypothetical protein
LGLVMFDDTAKQGAISKARRNGNRDIAKERKRERRPAVSAFFAVSSSRPFAIRDWRTATIAIWRSHATNRQKRGGTAQGERGRKSMTQRRL